MKVDAILPAGGRISGAFAAEAGAVIKALIRFDDRTILEHTIEAVRAVDAVQRVVVIGSPELMQHPAAAGADVVLAEGDTGVDNIYRGLDWLQESHQSAAANQVLILTTDLPFVRAAAIDGFLQACVAERVIHLPIFTRDEIEARFPGLGGSYIRLCDGRWTVGGAFLLDAVALRRNRAHIEKVYATRKSGVAMALQMGPALIVRYLCGLAGVPHVQARCERILGCAGATVRGCAPELAFDIDLIEEYHYAVKWVAQQRAAIES